MSKRIPKFDGSINGRRFRVYATRSGYEVIADDGDIDDPDAEVMVYPKFGGPEMWAHQGALDLRPKEGEGTDE